MSFAIGNESRQNNVQRNIKTSSVDNIPSLTETAAQNTNIKV